MAPLHPARSHHLLRYNTSLWRFDNFFALQFYKVWPERVLLTVLIILHMFLAIGLEIEKLTVAS